MALTASGGVLSLGANNDVVVDVVGRATTRSIKSSDHRIHRSSGGAVEGIAVAASPSLACCSCRGVAPKTRGVVASGKAEAGEADSSSGAALNLSRRCLILSAAGLVAVTVGNGRDEGTARAEVPSYRKFVDRLDGYTFSYPSGWIQVRGAGADVFFRDPVNLDENVLVEMSSPSSSKFKGVEDLGTPEQAAKQVLRQQLTEFMSTRIGVRREAAVTDARARRGDDGRLYYEVEVTASSYANNNQLAVMPGDRVAQLEWSRRYLSVLGVENNRLYQLRLQVPEKVADLEQQDLRRIMESFKVLTIEA